MSTYTGKNQTCNVYSIRAFRVNGCPVNERNANALFRILGFVAISRGEIYVTSMPETKLLWDGSYINELRHVHGTRPRCEVGAFLSFSCAMLDLSKSKLVTGAEANRPK